MGAECRVQRTSKVTVQSGNDTVSLAGIEGNTGIPSGFGAVGPSWEFSSGRRSKKATEEGLGGWTVSNHIRLHPCIVRPPGPVSCKVYYV